MDFTVRFLLFETFSTLCFKRLEYLCVCDQRVRIVHRAYKNFLNDTSTVRNNLPNSCWLMLNWAFDAPITSPNNE